MFTQIKLFGLFCGSIFWVLLFSATVDAATIGGTVLFDTTTGPRWRFATGFPKPNDALHPGTAGRRCNRKRRPLAGLRHDARFNFAAGTVRVRRPFAPARHHRIRRRRAAVGVAGL